MECRQYIIEKSSLLKEHINILKKNHHSYGAWRLAAPYFKDKQLYQSPQNGDIIRKIKNKELFIYDLAPVTRWSSYECEKIEQGVKIHYNFNKTQSIKAKMKENNQKALVKENVEKDDTEVQEVPPLSSDEFINWSSISTSFAEGKIIFKA